jgi:FlaA1/EpsC-like NDP-sugar epimerase
MLVNNRFSQIDLLSSLVTGRQTSYFRQDLLDNEKSIHESVFATKILIFGASGFIATETIKTLIKFKPRAIIIVDINENSLTELIRIIRNKFSPTDLPNIYPILTDVTSDDIYKISKVHPDIDIIWNFSAVKHVRSERDPISLTRMFSVNILGMVSITRLANTLPNLKSLFSVSTDKAANPVSYMGASKKLMEQVLFTTCPQIASSARFANVAFSTGSLLESWLIRIANGEPVASPKDTLRYFITPEESGHLCLMASTLKKNVIFVPTLDAKTDLQNLESILFKILNYLELEPISYSSEVDAIRNSLDLSKLKKQAVLITDRDTAGEKAYEEFVGDQETLSNFLPSLDTISVNLKPKLSIESLCVDLTRITSELHQDLDSFSELVNSYIPKFNHTNSSKSLDARL